MAYVKDGAGKRKIVRLTCQQKALLQDLEALLAQAEWHPCRIGTEQKALLMTNNCQLVRRVRRKWYDRHSGHGVEVPPVYVEVAMEQAGLLEGDTGRRLISEEVFDLAVGSLNLFQQPLRQDVRARIGEYDVFCMQEVTPSTLPAILSAGRELGYNVSPAQRGCVHALAQRYSDVASCGSRTFDSCRRPALTACSSAGNQKRSMLGACHCALHRQRRVCSAASLGNGSSLWAAAFLQQTLICMPQRRCVSAIRSAGKMLGRQMVQR